MSPHDTTATPVEIRNLGITFTTDAGVVRVTDGLLFHRPGLASDREVVRRVEGLSGSTPMRWSVEPRFGYAAARTVGSRSCPTRAQSSSTCTTERPCRCRTLAAIPAR